MSRLQTFWLDALSTRGLDMSTRKSKPGVSWSLALGLFREGTRKNSSNGSWWWKQSPFYCCCPKPELPHWSWYAWSFWTRSKHPIPLQSDTSIWKCWGEGCQHRLRDVARCSDALNGLRKAKSMPTKLVQLGFVQSFFKQTHPVSRIPLLQCFPMKLQKWDMTYHIEASDRPSSKQLQSSCDFEYVAFKLR